MMACWNALKPSLHSCSSPPHLSPCHISGKSFALVRQWQKRSHSCAVHSPAQANGRATIRSWQASLTTGRSLIISAPFKSGECGMRWLGKEFLIGPCSKKSNKNVVTMSVVGPQNMNGLFMILTGCAAVGQVLETRTKWGSQISGPLLAMAAAVLLSGTGFIPSASPVYDMVFSTIMPLGAALTLLETNVWSAFSDAGSTMKAFWFGALGTILGTIVSFKIIGPSLGPDGWKIASSLCASYVGGSINYAATAQVLGLNSAHLLAAGMAADNLAMAVYFGIIMAIPDDSGKNSLGSAENIDILPEKRTPPSVESLAVSLAAATLACYAGDAMASMLPSTFAGSGLALMAVVASLFNALAGRLFRGSGHTNIPIFAGSQNLGGSVMLLFFAVVGASTGLKEALAGGWPLPIFIIILIIIHLTTILCLGRWSKLPTRSILIGSNANIGGPATAAAMANARCWPQLVRPALLVGTLGYTIGTGIGCLVGMRVLRPMF
ncbi:unnamed protein product [Calypogeia fissa]